jgi:hypothetical protein
MKTTPRSTDTIYEPLSTEGQTDPKLRDQRESADIIRELFMRELNNHPSLKVILPIAILSLFGGLPYTINEFKNLREAKEQLRTLNLENLTTEASRTLLCGDNPTYERTRASLGEEAVSELCENWGYGELTDYQRTTRQDLHNLTSETALRKIIKSQINEMPHVWHDDLQECVRSELLNPIQNSDTDEHRTWREDLRFALIRENSARQDDFVCEGMNNIQCTYTFDGIATVRLICDYQFTEESPPHVDGEVESGRYISDRYIGQE